MPAATKPLPPLTKSPTKSGTPRPPKAAAAPLPGWLARWCNWVRGLTPESLARGLVLFFAATLPLYYDLAVPEVSGDIRWMATSVFAGLGVLVLLAGALWRGQAKLSLRGPVHFWVVLGLVVWAALSFVDAINPDRGIILFKALVAQLTLMGLVYVLYTPRFGRQLVWALVLPLGFTSFLGIAQFFAWNDASFAEGVAHSGWFWTGWMFDVLGWLTGVVGPWLHHGWPTNQNPDLGFVGQITSYFLSSAVPGSTFANKNLAGSWTAMMLPLTLYLLLTSKTWRGQAVAAGLLAIGSLFFIYARARASWIALLAGLLVLAALVVLVPSWRRAMLSHLDWRHGLWLLLPVSVVFLHGGATSPTGAYAVNRTPGEQLEMLSDIANSWNEIGGRLAYNLNSTVIVKDHPLNGVGLGNFFGIWPAYHDAVVATPDNSYNVLARPQRTHTDLMQAFTELGIPGGILYVLTFVLGLAAAFKLAGARAGRLAGCVIGAGLSLMLLVVSLFLHARGFVPLAGVWLWLVPGVFGLATLGFTGQGLRLAWQLHRDDQKKALAPASDEQLLGLFVGTSLLVICINALMDFPMQLPTAPAAALMLGGLGTAMAMQAGLLKRVGPAKAWGVGRVGLGGMLAFSAAVWGIFLYDAWKFREGNIYLKAGMVRLFAGVVDDQTRLLMEEAARIYPYDPRIMEHLMVVYANYPGLSLLESLEKLETALTDDPWGPNHLVNLAGKYLQLAEISAAQGDQIQAVRALLRAEELYGRLQRVAGFSQFTWGIGGMLQLLQGRNAEAMALFERALRIDPNYVPAQQGYLTAQARLQGQQPPSAPAPVQGPR